MIAIPTHSDVPSTPTVGTGPEPSSASAASKWGFGKFLEKAQGGMTGTVDSTEKDVPSSATKKKEEDSTDSPTLLRAIDSLVPPPPRAMPALAVATVPTTSPAEISDDVGLPTDYSVPVSTTACASEEGVSPVASRTSAAPKVLSNSILDLPGNRESGTEESTAKFVGINSVPEDLKPGQPPTIVKNDVSRTVAPTQTPVAPEAASADDAPTPSISAVSAPAPVRSTTPLKATDNKPPVASKSFSAKLHQFGSRNLHPAVQETKDATVPVVKSVGKPHETGTPAGDPQQSDQLSGRPRTDAVTQCQTPDAKVSAADKEPAQIRPPQNCSVSQERTEPQPSSTHSEQAMPASPVLSIAGAPAHAALDDRQSESQTSGVPQTEHCATSPHPTASINLARVVDGLRRSEMHIGLRTAAFGAVEVHTVIKENQVGLSVGTEKGDLKTLLATEVPTLRAALHHQDLHFEGIRFLSDNSGVRSDLGSGGHSEERPFRQSWPQRAESSAANEIPAAALPENSSVATGLSVHA